MIKANGRSALIIAIGFLVGFAGPSHAAAGADGEAPALMAQAGNGAQPDTAAQPAIVNQVPGGAMSTSDASAAHTAPVMAAAGEHSVWDETSLIGKIFIGFGALLTLASAARMFMA